MSYIHVWPEYGLGYSHYSVPPYGMPPPLPPSMPPFGSMTPTTLFLVPPTPQAMSTAPHEKLQPIGCTKGMSRIQCIIVLHII